jgi:spore maturation protein CgeB
MPSASRERPRVLVAGAYAFAMYEPAFVEGLERAGAVVERFVDRAWFGPGDLLRRAQSRWVFGPGIHLARAALLARVASERPDVLLGWRTPWLDARTMELARMLGARRVVTYNNDDPFGPDRAKRIWRAYRRSLPSVDVAYVYRTVNVEEALSAGAPRARVLRSAYDAHVHRPLEATDPRVRAFASDVAFVGHHEPDGRVEALVHLARAALDVRVWGSGWEPHAARLRAEGVSVGGPVLGDDYVAALQAAKVALVFLSTRNRDTYTRRCFEIPAIGTAMVAPRTRDMEALFHDGEEALFYEDTGELVSLVRALVEDAPRRHQLALRGRRRVERDGHDVNSRAATWLSDVLDVPGRAARLPARTRA